MSAGHRHGRAHPGDNGAPREVSRPGRGEDAELGDLGAGSQRRSPCRGSRARRTRPSRPAASPYPRDGVPRQPRGGQDPPAHSPFWCSSRTSFAAARCWPPGLRDRRERPGGETRRSSARRQPGPRCVPSRPPGPAALCCRARPAGRSRGGPAALTCPAIPSPGITPRTPPALRAAPSGLRGAPRERCPRSAGPAPHGERSPRRRSPGSSEPPAPRCRESGRARAAAQQLHREKKITGTEIPPKAPRQPVEGVAGRRAGAVPAAGAVPVAAERAGRHRLLRRLPRHVPGRARRAHCGPAPPHVRGGTPVSPSPSPVRSPSQSPSRAGPPGRTDPPGSCPPRRGCARGFAASPECPRVFFTTRSSVVAYKGFSPHDSCFFPVALK